MNATERQMAEQLAALEPGSERYRVLVVAIDFKRSWVELAQHLAQVQRTGQFKEWGYRTFQAYARGELHLRRETAEKLVRAVSFLESHEPAELAARKEAKPLPDFQALDALAQARSTPQLADDLYQELRKAVFDDGAPATEVKRRLREMTPKPAKDRDDPIARVAKVLNLAERLHGAVLQEETIPEAIAKHVERAAAGLRRMLED